MSTRKRSAPSLRKLLGGDMWVVLAVVIGLSAIAYAAFDAIASRGGEGVKQVARAAQTAILRSALVVIAVVGAARLALGIVGGPVMWGVTAAAWILSGGYDTVAGQLGLPTVGGITARLRGGGARGGDCPAGFVLGPDGNCQRVEVVG